MPSKKNDQKGSFWLTLPGIITAIAGLITAIGGLVTVLNTTGLLKPQPTATTTPPTLAQITSTIALLLPTQWSNPSPTATNVPTIPTEVDLPLNIADDKGVEMALVSAGTFTLGSEIDNDLKECEKYSIKCQPKWFADEGPSHIGYLDSFYLDKYEVSNSLYRACEEAHACKEHTKSDSHTRTRYYDDPQFDNYPVIYIDWAEANAYCQWRGGYLPTEAQWEKAGRGTNGNTYPWGNELVKNQVNFCDINCDLQVANPKYDDGYNDTSPVNSYSRGASLYGVYNMAGNVYEWVADLYAVYLGGDQNGSPYYGKGYRVIRGGSWASSIDLIRTSNRDPSPQTNTSWDIGFRCAKDATP